MALAPRPRCSPTGASGEEKSGRGEIQRCWKGERQSQAIRACNHGPAGMPGGALGCLWCDTGVTQHPSKQPQLRSPTPATPGPLRRCQQGRGPRGPLQSDPQGCSRRGTATKPPQPTPVTTGALSSRAPRSHTGQGLGGFGHHGHAGFQHRHHKPSPNNTLGLWEGLRDHTGTAQPPAGCSNTPAAALGREPGAPTLPGTAPLPAARMAQLPKSRPWAHTRSTSSPRARALLGSTIRKRRVITW